MPEMANSLSRSGLMVNPTVWLTHSENKRKIANHGTDAPTLQAALRSDHPPPPKWRTHSARPALVRGSRTLFFELPAVCAFNPGS